MSRYSLLFAFLLVVAAAGCDDDARIVVNGSVIASTDEIPSTGFVFDQDTTLADDRADCDDPLAGHCVLTWSESSEYPELSELDLAIIRTNIEEGDHSIRAFRMSDDGNGEFELSVELDQNEFSTSSERCEVDLLIFYEADSVLELDFNCDFLDSTGQPAHVEAALVVEGCEEH